MTTLNNHFNSTIKPMIKANSKLVLALSGGVDSRVLLELLSDYKNENPHIECLAVHVHHGLSDNAETWAKSCQRWCAEREVPFVLERVQLERKTRTSLEEQARNARYMALSKHLTPDDLLLVGQHLDDQLETFLLALKRGSGPKGLSAMAQVKAFGHANLVRPLLEVRRADIEFFAQSRELDWVEDESNQDTRFDRNFIRHQITPVLTERWPNFPQSVSRSAQLCAEQELLLEELLMPIYHSSLHSDGSLLLNQLDTFSRLKLNHIIRMWFAGLGAAMPSRSQLNKIYQEVIHATQDANPKLLVQGREVRRFEQRLYLVPQYKDVGQWQGNLTLGETLVLPDGLGAISMFCAKQVNLADDEDDGVVLHYCTLPDTDISVKVGFEPQGLSAAPQGRSGSRKLKKLFQEYSVPSWLRRRTPILKYNENVLAVTGLFVSKHYLGQEIVLIWRR
ncbi:tRNA lysidine(34) synthetase TilS [Vibrio maerlii]|uniref:tRNA lysidine(34) synthetase TilS n=1 Tax=Vibrio maerlii TaxID=2231648 RepID=UPI000E3E7B0E|nr:tRNA lysidine(34) synthetase TilS [Vibrio maerlii]